MAKMTSRERVRLALRHEEADMVPIDFGAMRSTGINAMAYAKLKDHLGIKDGRVRVYDVFQQLAEPEKEVLDRMGGDVVQIHRLKTSFGIKNDRWKSSVLQDGTPCEVPYDFNPVKNEKGDMDILDEQGRVVARMPDGGFYYDQLLHPYEDLDTEDEIDQMPLDKITEEEVAFLKKQAKELYETTDYAILGAFGGNIFEAGQMDWSYERYFIELALNPDLMHYYHNRLAQNYMENLKIYLDAIGDYIDVIQFGDDLGTQETGQISTDMYREMIKPYQQMQFEYVRNNYPHVKVFLHSCGAIYDLIPDLIDAGVEVLNPVQISAKNMDPVKLKKEFGSNLTFWGGGSNMQETTAFGDLPQIKKEVEELVKIFAPKGGFVFNQVHNIQANVSPEKILAIYDTAAKFRNYS